MNLFFDIDGTIWDTSERLYHLFVDLTHSDIPKEDYLARKRSKCTNEEILCSLGYSQCFIDEFRKQWMGLIENESYLRYNQLFPYTVPTLQFLKEKEHSIFLVTLRQFDNSLIKEVESKGLSAFITACYVSHDHKHKERVIIEKGQPYSSQDYWIGDTGVDVLAAKSLGMNSVAVLSGVRNREVLETYKPDYIFETIADLQTIL